MPNFYVSPNMQLSLPVPEVAPGPDWANTLNASLTVIDAHTHAPGSGVPITPSGLNINADLAFNNQNLTGAKTLRLQSQSGTLSGAQDLGCLYEVNNDLYFNDGSGTAIRLTLSGAPAGTSGSIGNLVSPAAATYVTATSTYVFQSAANTSANLDGASVLLRNLTANSKALTLAPPNAMSSNYTLTLPSLPAQTNVVSLDTSGNMGSLTYDQVGQGMTFVGANAIANTRTRTTGTSVAAGGIARSNDSAAFTSADTNWANVTNLSATITTTGRPVRICLLSTVSGGIVGLSGSGQIAANLQFVQSGGVGGIAKFRIYGQGNFSYPVGGFDHIEPLSAGTYTFTVQVAVDVGTTTFNVQNVRLCAHEL